MSDQPFDESVVFVNTHIGRTTLQNAIYEIENQIATIKGNTSLMPYHYSNTPNLQSLQQDLTELERMTEKIAVGDDQQAQYPPQQSVLSLSQGLSTAMEVLTTMCQRVDALERENAMLRKRFNIQPEEMDTVL